MGAQSVRANGMPRCRPKAPVCDALTAMASITSSTQRTRFWKIFPSSGRTGLHCIALHCIASHRMPRPRPATPRRMRRGLPDHHCTAPVVRRKKNAITRSPCAVALRDGKGARALEEQAQHAHRRVMPRAREASTDVP
jgi:hypothetical protein